MPALDLLRELQSAGAVELRGAVSLVLLAAARTVPCGVLVLSVGTRVVPPSVAVALGLLPVLLAFPQLRPASDALAALPGWVLAGLAVKEALVGAALGLAVAAVLLGAAAAGGLWDFAHAGRPEEGPLQRLHVQLAALLFFVMGGHRTLVSALALSFAVLPVQAVPAAEGARPAAFAAVRLSAEVLVLALALAAPALVALVLAQVLLGVAARGTRVGLLAGWGAPVRALLLLGVLAGSTAALASALPPLFDGALAQLDAALRTLARGGS